MSLEIERVNRGEPGDRTYIRYGQYEAVVAVYGDNARIIAMQPVEVTGQTTAEELRMYARFLLAVGRVLRDMRAELAVANALAGKES